MTSPARAVSLSSAEQRPAPILPDKPSIAVLPFVVIGGGPEQEYFARGMAEEIITTLSRCNWMFVIARNSSFTYKDSAIDVRQASDQARQPRLTPGSAALSRGAGLEYA